MRVGVISDTHGLLRDEVVARLRTCERILHAGDVGKEAMLETLRAIAPTWAVRGNVDHGAWAQRLPLTLDVRWEKTAIHVVHDFGDLSLDPVQAGVRLVISGHSHRASLEERAGVTYLNPGSVGPRRFRLPVAMAILHLRNSGGFEIELLQLTDESR
jgi:putative phosphoesterase